MKTGFIALILLIVVILIALFTWNAEKDSINTFLALRHEEAINIERRMFRTGPYFPDKNRPVYKVNTNKGNIYWFRFGLFGKDVKQEDGGDYITIE